MKCVLCNADMLLSECGIYYTKQICSACIRRIEHNIFSYDYKPEPKMLGNSNACHFGFEMEIHSPYFPREKLAKILTHNIPFIYCKNDGSLNRTMGFEIVSYPFTLDYINDNIEKFELLDTILYKYQCTSSHNRLCGLHIHVEKKFFTALSVYKFIHFVINNQLFINQISQRYKQDLERWAGTRGVERCNQVMLAKCAVEVNEEMQRYFPDKHVAVNVQPKNSIEVRIFNGTTSLYTLRKSIEFCDALRVFAGEVSIVNNRVGVFMQFIDKHKDEYKHLHNFILENII